MSLQRILALLALPVVTVFVIAGCASPSPSTDSGDKDTDSSETEDEEDEADVPEEGELAEPGTTVGADVWLTHSFTSTDDVEALISSRLVSVEKVTDEQYTFLNETFDEGQLEGYDVYMILVEEKKESGDSIEFDADYTFYDPIDKDGEKVQPITLIGWDECQTPSFDEAFDTAGGVLTQCLLAAVPEGEDGPAGVAYTGGDEDDNPYDYLDGKPLFFIID